MGWVCSRNALEGGDGGLEILAPVGPDREQVRTADAKRFQLVFRALPGPEVGRDAQWDNRNAFRLQAKQLDDSGRRELRVREHHRRPADRARDDETVLQNIRPREPFRMVPRQYVRERDNQRYR